jgi:xanthine dehydrogenase accessory factor
MIGSTRKARTIAEHFVRQKIATTEQVGRVACPVGLPIRARSVPEIAVSILAQYIDQRAGLAQEGCIASAGRFELVSSSAKQSS